MERILDTICLKKVLKPSISSVSVCILGFLATSSSIISKMTCCADLYLLSAPVPVHTMCFRFPEETSVFFFLCRGGRNLSSLPVFIFVILKWVLNVLHLLLSKTSILPFPSELLPCSDSTPTNSRVHIFPTQVIPRSLQAAFFRVSPVCAIEIILHFSSLSPIHFFCFLPLLPVSSIALDSVAILAAYWSLLLVFPLPLLTFHLKLWFSLLHAVFFF